MKTRIHVNQHNIRANAKCEVCGKAKDDVGGKERPSLCLACQKVWQHINDRWNILKKEKHMRVPK